MKLLLLGRNGQVGEALQATLGRLGQVVAWGREAACFEEPERLAERVAAQKADVIVNAAAYTAVDRAESEPARAFLINARAVSALAAVAERQGAWLVHFSTDYVFDGRKPDSYAEDDAPNPLSVYGRSKLAGDDAIVASGCLHLIFRISWVYAPGHPNFPRTMLQLARERSSLDVVADQVGAPTAARLVAAATVRVIARTGRGRAASSLSGVYHLAPSGATDRADLARFVVREASARGADLALSPGAIRSVTTDAYPASASRPLNSCLDTAKLRRTFGMDFRPWQDDMRAWIACELAGVGP
jgi:dTDP-4-dehydrorhamnose reductase